MIRERFVPQPEADPDYAPHFAYETTGPATIATLHVDDNGSVWLESNDGQKVAIPGVIRKLIAKRLRGNA